MAGPAASPLRPKLGLLFFTSGWFREVGLQKHAGGPPALPGLTLST